VRPRPAGTGALSRACILDTDPGTDDAVAIWLALASPELDIRLVTVAGGNAGLERTLPNARAVVGLSGRPVPVVAGADRALLGVFTAEPRVHGADGLGGVVLPDGPPAAPGIAADAIRAVLRAAEPASVTLIGIGPATNLALALATEPALAGRVAEIVLMSGAVSEGNITPAAEFNAWSDPEALAILLGCGRPVTLVTLDLTAQALVTPARIAALRGAGGRRHPLGEPPLPPLRTPRRAAARSLRGGLARRAGAVPRAGGVGRGGVRRRAGERPDPCGPLGTDGPPSLRHAARSTGCGGVLRAAGGADRSPAVARRLRACCGAGANPVRRTPDARHR
jgi:purine nucleosidase